MRKSICGRCSSHSRRFPQDLWTWRVSAFQGEPQERELARQTEAERRWMTARSTSNVGCKLSRAQESGGKDTMPGLFSSSSFSLRSILMYFTFGLCDVMDDYATRQRSHHAASHHGAQNTFPSAVAIMVLVLDQFGRCGGM